MAASWLEGVPLIGGAFAKENNAKAVKNLAAKYNDIDKNLFSGIGQDQESQDIYRNGIQALKQRAQNGFTDAERAQMQGFNAQTNAATRGQRENILNNARTAGSLTSGNVLGSQLAANEAGGMQKMQNQLGQAAQASKNSMAANQGLLDQRAQKFAQDLQLAQTRGNLQSGGNLFNYNALQNANQQSSADRQQNTNILSAILALL